jgi:DNA-binding NtrC family response regulator
MTGNCRVLVVEDDPSVRRAFERAFRIAGYQADFATSVQEGLQKLNGHQVALVDLHLPDGYGTALLTKIRHEGRPVRVAIYSGLCDAETIVANCGERPDAMFRKPVEFEKVLEWIATPGA